MSEERLTDEEVALLIEIWANRADPVSMVEFVERFDCKDCPDDQDFVWWLVTRLIKTLGAYREQIAELKALGKTEAPEA